MGARLLLAACAPAVKLCLQRSMYEHAHNGPSTPMGFDTHGTMLLPFNIRRSSRQVASQSASLAMLSQAIGQPGQGVCDRTSSPDPLSGFSRFSLCRTTPSTSGSAEGAPPAVVEDGSTQRLGTPHSMRGAQPSAAGAPPTAAATGRSRGGGSGGATEANIPALVSMNPAFLGLFQTCHNIMATHIGTCSGAGVGNERLQTSHGSAATDETNPYLFPAYHNQQASKSVPVEPIMPYRAFPITATAAGGRADGQPVGAQGMGPQLDHPLLAAPSALAAASASVPSQGCAHSQGHASVSLAERECVSTALVQVPSPRTKLMAHAGSAHPGQGFPTVANLTLAGAAGPSSGSLAVHARLLAHARSGRRSLSIPQHAALLQLLQMHSTHSGTGSGRGRGRGRGAEVHQQGLAEGQGSQGGEWRDLMRAWNDHPEDGDQGIGPCSSMWASLLLSTQDVHEGQCQNQE